MKGYVNWASFIDAPNSSFKLPESVMVWSVSKSWWELRMWTAKSGPWQLSHTIKHPFLSMDSEIMGGGVSQAHSPQLPQTCHSGCYHDPNIRVWMMGFFLFRVKWSKTFLWVISGLTWDWMHGLHDASFVLITGSLSLLITDRIQSVQTKQTGEAAISHMKASKMQRMSD